MARGGARRRERRASADARRHRTHAMRPHATLAMDTPPDTLEDLRIRDAELRRFEEEFVARRRKRLLAAEHEATATGGDRTSAHDALVAFDRSSIDSAAGRAPEPQPAQEQQQQQTLAAAPPRSSAEPWPDLPGTASPRSPLSARSTSHSPVHAVTRSPTSSRTSPQTAMRSRAPFDAQQVPRRAAARGGARPPPAAPANTVRSKRAPNANTQLQAAQAPASAPASASARGPARRPAAGAPAKKTANTTQVPAPAARDLHAKDTLDLSSLLSNVQPLLHALDAQQRQEMDRVLADERREILQAQRRAAARQRAVAALEDAIARDARARDRSELPTSPSPTPWAAEPDSQPHVDTLTAAELAVEEDVLRADLAAYEEEAAAAEARLAELQQAQDHTRAIAKEREMLREVQAQLNAEQLAMDREQRALAQILGDVSQAAHAVRRTLDRAGGGTADRPAS